MIDTGKADIETVGQVVKWANMDLLPEEWWSDEPARMLNGSGELAVSLFLRSSLRTRMQG